MYFYLLGISRPMRTGEEPAVALHSIRASEGFPPREPRFVDFRCAREERRVPPFLESDASRLTLWRTVWRKTAEAK